MPVRARALYGFVAWIAIHVCYTIFLSWATLHAGARAHESWHHLVSGQALWALALPCWVLVTLVFLVVLYGSYNAMHLPDQFDIIIKLPVKMPVSR